MSIAAPTSKTVHDVILIPLDTVGTPIPGQLAFSLREPHYRQTEQAWTQAGEPRANVTVGVLGDVLEIAVTAITGEIVVPRAREENLLDNERPDVNADGIELFIGPGTNTPWSASWLVVPASEAATPTEPGRPRITATTVGSPALNADWFRMQFDKKYEGCAGVDEGYVMTLRLPLRALPVQADGTFVMEIIVNERPADRVRRRGQLVLSGGGGFAYLRGDRADSADALTFRLPTPS